LAALAARDNGNNRAERKGGEFEKQQKEGYMEKWLRKLMAKATMYLLRPDCCNLTLKKRLLHSDIAL
jgi:hypothetical protein